MRGAAELMVGVLPESARRAIDVALVVVVQTFMLIQVGVFDVQLRLKGKRLQSARKARSPSTSRAPLQSISVVVPAFNEARSIVKCLDTLQRGATSLTRVQLVVVDAGCKDNTMALASDWAAACPAVQMMTTTSTGGRGPAVAAGVRLSTADAILVLHADTALPPAWDEQILMALSDPTVLMTAFAFGTDRTQLANASSPPAGLSLMEWTVNLRSRWYELPFGDQALATTRKTLEAVGGYPETCILEEFILVNRLRAMSAAGLGRIVTLDACALCSPRRWENSSVWRINAVNQAVMLWHKWGATPSQVRQSPRSLLPSARPHHPHRPPLRMLAPPPPRLAAHVATSSFSHGRLLSYSQGLTLPSCLLLTPPCAHTAQVFEFYYGIPAPKPRPRLKGAPPPEGWDATSRCVNGERSAAWAALFTARKAVFVHIPRCAGTSVEASLFGQSDYSQHLTAHELRSLVGSGVYASALTIAFVREPLDRYLSAFYYLLYRQGTLVAPGDGDGGVGGAGGGGVGGAGGGGVGGAGGGGVGVGGESPLVVISPHDTITSDVLRRDFESDPLGYLRHLHSLGGAWERAPIHFRPQTYFLPDGGTAALKFVGRFESLQADYARLIGAAGAHLAHDAHTHLAHLRQVSGDGNAPTGGRLAWARSEELAALVRVVYAADYEALGYK